MALSCKSVITLMSGSMESSLQHKILFQQNRVQAYFYQLVNDESENIT